MIKKLCDLHCFIYGRTKILAWRVSKKCHFPQGLRSLSSSPWINFLSVSWNACMYFFDLFSSTLLKFDPGAIILPVQLQSCWHNDRGFLSGRCPAYRIAVLCGGLVPAEAAVALVPRSQRKCWTLQLVASNRDFSLLTDWERPETRKSAKKTLQQRGGGGKSRPKHPDRSVWNSAGTWDSSLTQHKQPRYNLTGCQWRLLLCVCLVQFQSVLSYPPTFNSSFNFLQKSFKKGPSEFAVKGNQFCCMAEVWHRNKI